MSIETRYRPISLLSLDTSFAPPTAAHAADRFRASDRPALSFLAVSEIRERDNRAGALLLAPGVPLSAT
jgi:hypothetical protein